MEKLIQNSKNLLLNRDQMRNIIGGTNELVDMDGTNKCNQDCAGDAFCYIDGATTCLTCNYYHAHGYYRCG